jgi:hypothetical protein
VFADCTGLCGLVTSFGATTVTPGSEVEFVCEAAGTLRAQSNAVDRRTTAEGTTRLDGILITPNPDINAVRVRTPHQISNQPFGSGRHMLVGKDSRRAVWAITDVLIA